MNIKRNLTHLQLYSFPAACFNLITKLQVALYTFIFGAVVNIVALDWCFVRDTKPDTPGALVISVSFHMLDGHARAGEVRGGGGGSVHVNKGFRHSVIL